MHSKRNDRRIVLSEILKTLTLVDGWSSYKRLLLLYLLVITTSYLICTTCLRIIIALYILPGEDFIFIFFFYGHCYGEKNHNRDS